MAKVGFVGLGIMGAPMAGHLIKGGHQVFLYTRGSVPHALVEIGGVVCANGKEVAQKSDIVITMVPDTPHVQSALFDANGIAAGLSKGKIRRRHELDLADRHHGASRNGSMRSAANISMHRCPAASWAPRRHR